MFIRHEVPAELVDDQTSPIDLYGYTRSYYSYKDGFSAMPLVWGNDYPLVEDADGGRVMLLGA